MDSVKTFKLVAAGVVWLQAIVGGGAPLVLKGRVSPVAISVLNMFAGGIFLAGSCLHLLPDAQANEALAAAGCFENGKCFQLANFFYAIGFLAVLLLEVFAHEVQRQFGDKNAIVDERTPLIVNTNTKDRIVQAPPSLNRNDDLVYPPSDQHKHNGGHATRMHSANGHSHGSSQNGIVYGLSATREPVSGLPADSEACVDMEVTHAHIHSIMDANPALAFIVFAALSFHSVMEGMGVGASNGEAWGILIAILAHKSLAAFALSLELLHHKVPRERLMMTIALFSIMSPLGIFLGALLVDKSKETPASGICSAMAGGTFLFVAVMETIPQELQNKKFVGTKCSALLVGFLAMGVLSIWS